MQDLQLLSLKKLSLLSATDLLCLVLKILLHTATTTVDLLGSKASTVKTIVGLELLKGSFVVIDETEASGAATTEGRLEAEEGDALSISNLVCSSKLSLDLLAARGSSTRVNNINDELLTLEERVVEEPLSSDSELSHFQPNLV